MKRRRGKGWRMKIHEYFLLRLSFVFERREEDGRNNLESEERSVSPSDPYGRVLRKPKRCLTVIYQSEDSTPASASWSESDVNRRERERDCSFHEWIYQTPPQVQIRSKVVVLIQSHSFILLHIHDVIIDVKVTQERRKEEKVILSFSSHCLSFFSSFIHIFDSFFFHSFIPFICFFPFFLELCHTTVPQVQTHTNGVHACVLHISPQ